jgi:hypothetical protein
MPTTIKEQILDVVIEILDQEPLGLQYGELARKTRESFEGTEIAYKIRPNAGRLNRLIYHSAVKPDYSPIDRPRRGFYRHKRFIEI